MSWTLVAVVIGGTVVAALVKVGMSERGTGCGSALRFPYAAAARASRSVVGGSA